MLSPLLIKALIYKKNGKALDIGIGSGEDSIFLSRKFKVTAIDTEKVILPKNIKFIQANILNYDFKKKFDLINCTYMLHLLRKDARKILKKIQDSTSKKGINLIITFRDKGEFTYKNPGFFKKNELKKIYSG